MFVKMLHAVETLNTVDDNKSNQLGKTQNLPEIPGSLKQQSSDITCI